MTELNPETIDSIRREIRKCIPQLSLNCVIFRFDGEGLQVPVVQPVNTTVWVIPGGYIHQQEDIDDAARRILFEQTQIDGLILSQFGTYGAAAREFAEEIYSYSNLGFPADILEHISQRFVTIGYYSIVGSQKTLLKTGPFFTQARWVKLAETGKLALDHSILVSEALKTLRAELLSQPLLLSFMPETFTIPELQKLYEAILGRPVDRGNFRQRILKSGILVKIGPTREKTPNRPPILYKLNKESYMESLTQDVKLGF